MLNASAPPGLQTALLLLILGCAVWYSLRVALAAALLLVARHDPRAVRWAFAVTPGALRPLARRAVAGGLLTAALTGPAALAAQPPGCGDPSAVPVLDRGDACGAGEDASPATAAAAVPEPTEVAVLRGHHRVEPGESLWSITADALGPGADDARIAHAWPQLWQSNRSTIGEDPDFIVAGTDLVIPDGLQGPVTP